MKYQVGEWVKVADDAGEFEINDPIFFDRRMEKYRGNEYRVKGLVIDNDYYTHYILENVSDDDYYWRWSALWLEPTTTMNDIDESNIDKLFKELV